MPLAANRIKQRLQSTLTLELICAKKKTVNFSMKKKVLDITLTESMPFSTVHCPK